MKNKKIIIISLIALVLAFGGIYFFTTSNPTNTVQTETSNYPINDMSSYPKIKAGTSRYIDGNPSDLLDQLIAMKEGIYFIGYADCPWCQELAPVLNKVLIDQNKNAYYINIRDERLTDTQTFFDKLSAFDLSLGDKGSDNSVPFVLNVDKNGNIKTHVGTLPGHNAYESSLTSEQEKELTNQIVQLIK